MIIGGPSIGGLLRSLKKLYQRQVNNVHKIPPIEAKTNGQGHVFLRRKRQRGEAAS